MDDEEIKAALMANSSVFLDSVPNSYSFSDGTGLIHWASMYNNLDVCHRLVKDPGIVNSVGGALDSSPLYYALYNSNYKVMKLLIENGADITYVNKSGMGLLHTCARFDDVLGMVLLLSYGADAGVEDFKGRTLRVYARGKRARNVERFLEANRVTDRYKIWMIEGISIGMHWGSFFLGKAWQVGVVAVFLIFWGRVARTRLPVYLNLFYSFYISYKVLGEDFEHTTHTLEYFFNLVCLFLTRPRFGPVGTYQEARELVSTMIEQDEYTMEHFCYTCLVRKAGGTKHCSICERCVLGFDHHCPCINKCVSKDSMKLFQRHLLSTLTVTMGVLLSGRTPDVSLELMSVAAFVVLVLVASASVKSPRPV
ncbi:ankyrin repeat-containing protein [Encephalitozoon intestinalis ATCC 50506]|uniref:Palmitoyltransferase n=1 Tax=Encephalitozoon intestinalis (strain ATCC 50506) TaxID=876142 RepID=E0S9K8_ENCIT|nr:ankyrin repeat-containing protein [Encephalitozoon intestinalis ATCC 50506]ADM12393.1 ankyrin repeat-containing protein [Encephalitozoon intestinalis ATCC 50506]UTX46225.1 DHHC palmitoyltransferase [Encephalitozoon intestinalis]